jgi:hypothetical protein
MPDILQNRIWLHIDGTRGNQDTLALLERIFNIYNRHMTYIQYIPSALAFRGQGGTIFRLDASHEEYGGGAQGVLQVTHDDDSNTAILSGEFVAGYEAN